MSAALQQLIPALRPYANRLLAEAARRGFRVQLTSVRRTTGVQTKLYRDYLAGRSKYPAAPPGHSMHELGRAFDITGTAAQLRSLGSLWESWGGTWGGRFNDPIHFEG